MPTLKKELDQYIIDSLPVKSVYILDRTSKQLSSKFPFVSQNFEDDIYSAFKKHLSIILKYKRIRLISNSKHIHIKQIGKGLKRFAHENNLNFSVNVVADTFKIQKGDLLIILSDRDLVKIIFIAQEQKIEVSKDFGIVSYNETDLKQVISIGITTISTDFEKMGRSIIDLIRRKERKRIYNPSILLIRNSI